MPNPRVSLPREGGKIVCCVFSLFELSLLTGAFLLSRPSGHLQGDAVVRLEVKPGTMAVRQRGT